MRTNHLFALVATVIVGLTGCGGTEPQEVSQLNQADIVLPPPPKIAILRCNADVNSYGQGYLTCNTDVCIPGLSPEALTRNGELVQMIYANGVPIKDYPALPYDIWTYVGCYSSNKLEIDIHDPFHLATLDWSRLQPLTGPRAVVYGSTNAIWSYPYEPLP
jgi:hypothetical protein